MPRPRIRLGSQACPFIAGSMVTTRLPSIDGILSCLSTERRVESGIVCARFKLVALASNPPYSCLVYWMLHTGTQIGYQSVT
jgi:hypothetical protein